MDSLFSTHPDTGNRIAALMEQARIMGVVGVGAAASGDQPGPWG